MRSRIIPLTLLSGLCVASPVAADQWAFTAFLGGTKTFSNALTLQQPSLDTDVSMKSVTYAGRAFDSPLYYGYRVTRFFNDNFGVEGEGIHLKAYARTDGIVHATGRLGGSPIDATVSLDSIVQRLSISHGLNFVLVNAVFRHPLNGAGRPRGWIVARAGAGFTVPHGESTIMGVSQEQYEMGSVALHGAIGGELRLTHHFSAIAEYKLTTTAESVSVANDGTVHGRFSSQHVVGGLVWRP